MSYSELVVTVKGAPVIGSFVRKPDVFGKDVDAVYVVNDGKTALQSVRFVELGVSDNDIRDLMLENGHSEYSIDRVNSESHRVISQRVVRYKDTPILGVVRSTRSNSDMVPEGAIMVPSFASTMNVDYYGTRVTRKFMDEAFPAYMSTVVPDVNNNGRFIKQGNLRHMHNSQKPAGYCRYYEVMPAGYLCYDIIPKSCRDVQEQILDQVLTGTSIGFSPYEWENPMNGDSPETFKFSGVEREVIDFVKGFIAERSVVDRPATPGCNFKELATHARSVLGQSRSFGVGIDIRGLDTREEPSLPSVDVGAGADAYSDSDSPADGGGESRMNLVLENGFRWFEARPLSDFKESSVRFGLEDTSGVVICGGMLKESVGYGSAVHKVGFNCRDGDGWFDDEIHLFMTLKSVSWYGDETISRAETPVARSRGVMAKFLGIGKLDKDATFLGEKGDGREDRSVADGVDADADASGDAGADADGDTDADADGDAGADAGGDENNSSGDAEDGEAEESGDEEMGIDEETLRSVLSAALEPINDRLKTLEERGADSPSDGGDGDDVADDAEPRGGVGDQPDENRGAEADAKFPVGMNVLRRGFDSKSVNIRDGLRGINW